LLLLLLFSLDSGIVEIVLLLDFIFSLVFFYRKEHLSPLLLSYY